MVVWTDKYAKYEAKRRGDAELTERKRASRRAQHAENAERLNARRCERQREDREGTRARQRRHDATEHGRAAKRLRHDERRARKRDAFVEDVDPLVVLEFHDGVCGVCRDDVDPFDFHVDHIVPLARGGEHSYRNVQPAHPTCNMRKGAREERV